MNKLSSLNSTLRKLFLTVIGMFALTTISAQHSCGNYGPGYSNEELTISGTGSFGFSYVSEPICSIGGLLFWIDSDRWAIRLDRTNFPQMEDGESYGILIAVGSEGFQYWYDMGNQFEYNDGRLYYDGLGINHIVCDGPWPETGNMDEADAREWMYWLTDWTKCYLFNDSYEWDYSSETSFKIRIYLR